DDHHHIVRSRNTDVRAVFWCRHLGLQAKDSLSFPPAPWLGVSDGGRRCTCRRGASSVPFDAMGSATEYWPLRRSVECCTRAYPVPGRIPGPYPDDPKCPGPVTPGRNGKSHPTESTGLNRID